MIYFSLERCGDTVKTLIFGHKKPDTDAVMSAIGLSYLKNKLGDFI